MQLVAKWQQARGDSRGVAVPRLGDIDVDVRKVDTTCRQMQGMLDPYMLQLNPFNPNLFNLNPVNPNCRK